MSLTERELSRFDGHAYPHFNFSVKKKRRKKSSHVLWYWQKWLFGAEEKYNILKKNWVPIRSLLCQCHCQKIFPAACYVACAWPTCTETGRLCVLWKHFLFAVNTKLDLCQWIATSGLLGALSDSCRRLPTLSASSTPNRLITATVNPWICTRKGVLSIHVRAK